jgi:hypothetical protein
LAIKEEAISGAELSELKALIADQQQRLDILESRQAAPDVEAPTKQQRSTRRQLLKLAGATLVGAAGSAALRAVPAAAANGDALLVGTIRDQDLNNVTGISLIGAANPGRALYSNAGGSSVGGQTAIWGGNFNNGRGVVGYGGGTFGTGVFGYTYSSSSSSIGVRGQTFSYGAFTGAGVGVLASSAGGDGLHAATTAQSRRAIYAYTSQTGSVGVAAYSQFGTAIRSGSSTSTALFAYSGNSQAIQWIAGSSTYAGIGGGNLGGGPDIKLGGSGRIVQLANISAGVGAPSYTPVTYTGGGGHSYFESVRADDGALWISGTTGSGKAKWRRVNAVRVDTADGTGAPYAPFRLYDSRSGAKKAAGSTTVVVVAGAGSGASKIPADAVAIIGNLTATQYTGTGFLSIAPGGVTVGTSTVNFITGQTAIANSFIVGLGTGGNAGKVQVKVAGHATHILIDVTGYLQ